MQKCFAYIPGAINIFNWQMARVLLVRHYINGEQNFLATRYSEMTRSKPLKSSWKKKMEEKAERKSVKARESELKEAKKEKQEVCVTNDLNRTTFFHLLQSNWCWIFF